MTNTRNDFKFYHGFGQLVREIRNEYQRLDQHPLSTLVAKVKTFCDSVPDQHCPVTTINAQSMGSSTQKTSLLIPSSTDLIIRRSTRLEWNLPCQ
ncbi:hypothetical protein TNCV_1632281 [Trichonephila clavipes]|nr:hypothetical protein TNCV_1632281 [Trichonephila clavipes]